MATIRVFSGGAPKPVFTYLSPAFERESGHKVDYVFAVIFPSAPKSGSFSPDGKWIAYSSSKSGRFEV